MVGWWFGFAAAQDPVEPAPVAGMFNADKVLVSTFQAEDTASAADAPRLAQLLVDRLAKDNEMVAMASVPRFMPQDYSAETYMDGCPPGKYSGCQLVVGQRVDTDRVIGATVRRDPDEFEADKTMLVLTVHLVDVNEAREIASFGVPVPTGKEVETIDGIGRVFDEVVRGDYELRDLRPEGPSADEVALEQERKQMVSASLAALEAELGTAVRTENVGRIAPPQMTRADLAAWDGREETPPWERVGMSPSRYLRYANSGDDLQTWRQTGNGRFGKVLVRGMAGAGGGPWHQRYAAQVLRDGTDLSVVDQVQLLEVINDSSLAGDVEIGFGVAPMIDVALGGTFRTGTTSYLFDEDVQGQVAIPSKPTDYGMSTRQFGPRVQFAPFPRLVARPTVGMGIAFWRGAGIPADPPLPRVDAPTATLLEVIPGFEADATPIVAFSTRAIVSLPLANDYITRREVGDPLIENPPTPTSDFGLGFTVQAGLLFRIGPVWGEREVRPLGENWDDEP